MLEQGTINIHTENIFDYQEVALLRPRNILAELVSMLMPFKSSKWYPVLENIQAIGGSGNPNLHR